MDLSDVIKEYEICSRWQTIKVFRKLKARLPFILIKLLVRKNHEINEAIIMALNVIQIARKKV